MNPVRAATVLRHQARLAMVAARDAVDSDTTTPVIVVAAEPVAASAPPQTKSRGASRADHYQVPIGTVVSVRLRTAIDSSVNHVNDQVDAVLSDPVRQDGVELIPSGSLLHGTILTVDAATRETPLGRVSFAFALIQHGESGSRAPFPTRAITIEAQPPTPPAGKHRRDPPTDVGLPVGHPLQLTLNEPLVVAIPKAR